MKRDLRFCNKAVFAALVVLVCFASLAFAEDKAPIKIGLMVPYTGALSFGGNGVDKGFRFGLEEAGYKVAGRTIELLKEDDEAKPEVGITKVHKLIEYDKVNILAGINHSGVALAVRDIVVSHKIPLIITNAGAVKLTSTLKSPYIFRTSFANGQQDLAGGWYAYNKMRYRRMVVVAADFVAGHEKADAFMKAFKAAGGQITQQIYPPLGTSDFGPYLTNIDTATNSAVWAFESDQDGIRFIQQYQEYGLKQKLPLFVIGDTVDDSLLPSMKDAALGTLNYLHYANTLDTPANQKFVKAYFARYKEFPSFYAEEGYVGAKAILLALQAVHGNVENTDAFLAALRQVKFEAPRGPFRFDADQNAVIPVYIRKVEKVDGRYANVVIDTIPNVDQNWVPPDQKK